MALVNNPVMGINLRKNKNSKNAGYGKYYPEVDLQKTLTIRGFAQHLIDHGSQSEPLAAPTISGKTSFSDSTTVSLSGPDGADIYYTLDGSTPTAESTMYTEAFELTDSATVKSIAILNGVSSEVASKTFTKNA